MINHQNMELAIFYSRKRIFFISSTDNEKTDAVSFLFQHTNKHIPNKASLPNITQQCNHHPRRNRCNTCIILLALYRVMTHHSMTMGLLGTFLHDQKVRRQARRIRACQFRFLFFIDISLYRALWEMAISNT